MLDTPRNKTQQNVILDTGCPVPAGIYSSEALPAEDYHALPRASATLFKSAINDPMEAWTMSWLNPRQRDEPTDAMRRGSAYHTRFLEGSEKFNIRYKTALKKEDYANALHTVKDMRDWLGAYDLAIPAKASKADLIRAVEKNDHAPPVWDTLVASHKKNNEGREIIKAETFEEIEFAYSLLEKDKVAREAVTGGLPEVSLLYTLQLPESVEGHSGYQIQCKARIDYLKYKSLISKPTRTI